MNIRIALAASAMTLALASVPAEAGREWFQDNGTNSWTHYNYLNYEHNAAGEIEAYGSANFIGAPDHYFLRYVTNSTSTGHCYEIELKKPENYPNNKTRLSAYFWDQSIGNWMDVLGFPAQGGKARLWLVNSEFQAFLATPTVPTNGTPRQAGFWVSRKNLTESQCTTGAQATFNWLKIVDGVQTKYIVPR